MSEPKSILDDTRTIGCISVCNGTASDLYCVGPRKGITRIVCYRESGEMSYVPWFAVYNGDVISQRINGKFVMEVNYLPEERPQ